MSEPKKIIFGLTHPLQQGINPLDLRNFHAAPAPLRLPKVHLQPFPMLPRVQPRRGPQELEVNQPIVPGMGLKPDSVRQAPGYQTDDIQGAGGNLNIQPSVNALHDAIRKLRVM